MAFDGFPASTFAWLAGLERENTREYFGRTREVYERDVRGALEELLETLAGEEFGTGVRLFRQQRDVRFSADKTPYKTRTYGLVHGLPEREAGHYAELSAAGLFAGAGHHWFAADQLERFRAAVDREDSGAALDATVRDLESRGFEVSGETLKTAPRGYPRDHPRARLLRHKAVFGGRRLAAGRHGIPRDAALEHVRGAWRDGRPLIAWVEDHVGPSTLPADARAGRRR